MPRHQRSLLALGRTLLLAMAIVTAAASMQPARAQVVALVNGVPITELDITQRIKLIQVSNRQTLNRQQALKQLVDDQIKIFTTRRYQVEASDADVDNAFNNMAQRAHVTTQQMEKMLAAQGIALSALKLRIRADIGWNQLIRGRYSSSLQINEVDIRNAMQSKPESDKDAGGNTYTLYPITFVVARASGGDVEARRREAENLRGRFQSCADGIKLARALNSVVVREPVVRSSADLTPQLREILDKMEVGRLTAPEMTEQGIQMFALCERKEGNADTPAKRAAREEIFNKRFEVESKRLLDEVRRQAMIEYR